MLESKQEVRQQGLSEHSAALTACMATFFTFPQHMPQFHGFSPSEVRIQIVGCGAAHVLHGISCGLTAD